MNKLHISLNSQFIVVLDGVICFSVRFCDNSLLVLKMRFQVFSFACKKVQGFSSDPQVLRYLGKHSLCLRNQPYFLANSDKNLLLPSQTNLKNLR